MINANRLVDKSSGRNTYGRLRTKKADAWSLTLAHSTCAANTHSKAIMLRLRIKQNLRGQAVD